MYDLNGAADEVRDQNGVTYEPWALGDMIGYRVWIPGGTVRYLYFNPSTDDDAGESNVFVYYGAEGDPAVDEPRHHYVISDPEEGDQ